MSYSAGAAVFKFGFELSPIVLTGGIFSDPGFPGGALPLIAITQPLAFVNGLLSGGDNVNFDSFFANFNPASGSTLIDNDIGHYPFANQAVAANAVIQKPTLLSMLMYCPAKGPDGYALKLATMTVLVQVLKYHIRKGGTFTVLTPAQIYTSGLLVKLTDVSGGESKQAQNTYQWDFEFPLLTQDDTQPFLNSTMNTLTGQTGGPIADPNSLAGVGTMPVGASVPGMTAAPLVPVAGVNLPPVTGATVEPGAYNIFGPLSTPAPAP